MFPILSVTLFLPLAGALLIMAIPRDDVKTIRRVGVAIAFATLALAVVTWVLVMQANAGQIPYPEEAYPWIPASSFNVQYHLRADGLNAPMAFLTGLMILLALFYSARTIETRVKEYFLLFLVLETSLFGVFLAFDLVMFYAFWVAGLMPMLLLISVWGGERRESAAIKFFLYNLLGSVAMLLGILAVYSQISTFDILQAAAERPFAGTPAAARFAFLAFFVSFAIRLPSFPFHTWLPDAQTEAPTPASAVLASVFLSTAGYGLIRIALPLFPEPFRHFSTQAPLIPVLAVISIVYGALVCMAQWDLKRLVSYSSVAQMGFAALGVCAAAAGHGLLEGEEAFNAAASGLNGAAMQIFAHGLIVGGLFFLVGILHRRTQTHDLKAFGGLARQIPHFYGLMLVAGFAALSLPGLIGFWGELFVFRGTVHFIAPAAFVGVLGVLFTAGYTLWKIVQHIFLGTLDEEKWGEMEDMNGWEKVTLWPLVLIIVVSGFYPTLVLDTFNAALTTLLENLP